jgi:hypothetical protein
MEVLMGKSSINRPFSISMLNNKRVLSQSNTEATYFGYVFCSESIGSPQEKTLTAAHDEFLITVIVKKRRDMARISLLNLPTICDTHVM